MMCLAVTTRRRASSWHAHTKPNILPRYLVKDIRSSLQ
jgi:hypothetical protein